MKRQESIEFVRTVPKVMVKIRQCLDKQKMKQADLAGAIGVAPSRISQWSQGTGLPNCYQIRKIAQVLGVTMDYLTDDTTEDPSVIPSMNKISESEAELVNTVRRMCGGAEEAMRRILNPNWAQDCSTPGNGK